MKIVLILLVSILLHARDIRIAVAANASYVIQDLKKAFHKHHPQTNIQVILGSSGKLTAQIRNGAPYMLFMSADMKYPQKLYQDGIAITKPIVYAKGSLAYLSAKKRDFSLGTKLLTQKEIKKIAVANPKTAPYGIATQEALQKSGIYESIKHKFVYGESISQTLTYAIKAADIGFIAKSALYSPHMTQYKKGIHWSDVNPKLYKPIDQGIVILKSAKANSEVEAFYTFIQSEEAKKILKEYGYQTP